MAFKKLFTTIALAAAAVGSHAASGVLNTGTIQMGVFDNAGLGALGVGFTGPTGDAIIRGCLCEGWGASAGSSDGFVYGGGQARITSALLTVTDSTGLDLSAQSVVMLSNGLQVTHTYSAASATLFKVNVTITNTTGGALADVRYARALDWDVDPGFFAQNFTTLYGGTPSGPGGKVLATSTDPFSSSTPLSVPTQEANTNVVDSTGDKGSYFSFGFGSLLAGASTSFDTFIGSERTVSELLASFASVGIEAYSYTTGSAIGSDGEHAPVYGYGFVGLDLPPSFDVPEPGSLALAGLALFGLAAARRRASKA